MTSQPVTGASATGPISNDQDIAFIHKYFEAVDSPAATVKDAETTVAEPNLAQTASHDDIVAEDSSDSSSDSDTDSSSSDDDDEDDDEDEENLPTIQDAASSMLASARMEGVETNTSTIREEIDRAIANDDDDDEPDMSMPKNLDTEDSFNGYYSKLQDRKVGPFTDYSFPADVETPIEHFASIKHWSGNLLILQYAPDFHNVPSGFRVVEPGTVVCTADRTIIGVVDELFGPVKEPLYSLRYDFQGYKKIEDMKLDIGLPIYRVVATSNTTTVNEVVDEQRQEEERLRQAEESNPNAEYTYDEDGEPLDPAQPGSSMRPGMSLRGKADSRGGMRGQRGHQRGGRDGHGRGDGQRGRRRGAPRGDPASQRNAYGGRGAYQDPDAPRGSSAGGFGYRDPDAPSATPAFGEYTPLSRHNAPPQYPPAPPQYRGFHAPGMAMYQQPPLPPPQPYQFGVQNVGGQAATAAFNPFASQQNHGAQPMYQNNQQYWNSAARPAQPPDAQTPQQLQNLLANMTPAQRASLINMAKNNQQGNQNGPWGAG